MILEVEPKHYEYLSIQHGSIASPENLADFTKWHTAYCASVGSIYQSIKPALPLTGVKSILDVGSGLGGIDIMLSRHYKTDNPEIWLLDGPDAPPHVFAHNLPFSHHDVMLDFHHKNGSTNVSCFYKNFPDKKFDIVLSFAAFGFHIAPFEYIGPLQEACHDNTVVIFDVRRERKEWLKQLITAFGQPKVLARAEKWVRCAFRGR